MPAYPPLLALAIPGLLKLAGDVRRWTRLPQAALASATLAAVVLNLTPASEVRA